MNPVARAVWSRARRHGARTAVVTGNRFLSFGELVEGCEAVADRIAARRPGGPGRALVRSRDPLEVLRFVLGCWRAECSAVVLHESAPEASVERVRRRVGAFTALVDGTWTAAESGGLGTPAPDPREALVLTTSGTSGAPKLVALPAESVRLNVETIAPLLGVDEGARLLVAQPLSRAYGLVGGCLVALVEGAEIHLEPPATPPPILQRAIRERELTVVQGPPAFFQLFMRYWNERPFPSVRTWTTGGELSSRQLLGRIQAAFPRARGHVIFGMTELGPRISHAPADDARVLEGWVGRPFDHVAWEVERSGRSEAGRLRLSGPALFLGYVGDDGAYGGIDADGFFTSPDLVTLEPDGSGLVHRGRKDRLFKVGGHIVNPALVEQTLLGLPGVRDAQCFAEPDPILGHVVAAEIVAGPDGPDVEAVLEACRRELDPPSVPRSVRQVEGTARGGVAQKRSRPRPTAGSHTGPGPGGSVA